MPLRNLIVLIKGGGDIASGVACRLWQSHFKICMTETARPQAVRRDVSFCEAVYDGEKTIEGLTAKRAGSFEQIEEIWDQGKMAVFVDPDNNLKNQLNPDVLVDAILAKKNLGTTLNDAPLVIGLGPGFFAGGDVHLVVETNRGHHLGRVIREGAAEKNTGVPGAIAGFSIERVFRSPCDGRLSAVKALGDDIEQGEVIAFVENDPVRAQIKGMIRGLLRNGTQVWEGMKLGDIDPRGVEALRYTVSDKARAIAGGVLEGILSHFNRPGMA